VGADSHLPPMTFNPIHNLQDEKSLIIIHDLFTRITNMINKNETPSSIA
jgi:hypothetical protein